MLALGATPLAASAASALRKLSFDLPGIAPDDDEAVLTRPAGPAFEKVFGVLREGVERRTAVRCRYYTISRDEERERVIEPYGLMFTWSAWYCIAHARDREALRVFRLDRMREAELLSGVEAVFAIPTDFSVQRYLDRAPWELSDAAPVPVRVRFGFPHSRWIMAEGLGTVIEATDGSGGAVLEFGVRTLDPFIRWLLPFGAQVEVLSPPEVRERLGSERQRIRDRYR